MPQCTAHGADAQGSWSCERKAVSNGLCDTHEHQRHRGKPLTRIALRRVIRRNDPQVPQLDLLCADIPVGHQECWHCGETKPFSEFYFSGRRVPRGECKQCLHDLSLDRNRSAGAAEHKKAKLIEQQGRCANVGCNKELVGRDACLDHSHAVSKDGSDPASWRGVLCLRCNLGLGQFGDDMSKIAGAMKYLLTHKYNEGGAAALVAAIGERDKADTKFDHGYSIGAAAYKRAALDAQSGVCGNKGCRKAIPIGGHLDHDHAISESGEDCRSWRGVLCRECNGGLGFYDDDVDKLIGLLRYLTEYAPRRP